MANKYNRKDNDGHKFDVPVELLEFFDESLEEYSRCKRFSEEYYKVERRFNYNFGMYMVG
jgi:hypothetical protein